MSKQDQLDQLFDEFKDEAFRLETLPAYGLSPVDLMVVGIHGAATGDPVENQRVYFPNPYSIPAC